MTTWTSPKIGGICQHPTT